GPDGSLDTVGMLFSPGYPGFLRGVIAGGAGEFIVTTAADTVAHEKSLRRVQPVHQRFHARAGDTQDGTRDRHQRCAVRPDR
ncbi:hypothetical protein PXH80_34000, partial [Mycolicibacterium smegmatis]|nr:hypothetical protein [Mycolicibacterium smegmatis]